MLSNIWPKSFSNDKIHITAVKMNTALNTSFMIKGHLQHTEQREIYQKL